MPSYPTVLPYIEKMQGRPFSKFAHILEETGETKYPLHIGDTYLQPFDGARIEDIKQKTYPNAHKYTSTKGHPALVQAISEHYSVDSSLIQVTPGATGALHLVTGTLLAPDEEVLVLAP